MVLTLTSVYKPAQILDISYGDAPSFLELVIALGSCALLSHLKRQTRQPTRENSISWWGCHAAIFEYLHLVALNALLVDANSGPCSRVWVPSSLVCGTGEHL